MFVFVTRAMLFCFLGDENKTKRIKKLSQKNVFLAFNVGSGQRKKKDEKRNWEKETTKRIKKLSQSSMFFWLLMLAHDKERNMMKREIGKRKPIREGEREKH